jgi:hypothetical protein
MTVDFINYVHNLYTVELGYNAMKGTEYFVSLWPRSIMLWLRVIN